MMIWCINTLPLQLQILMRCTIAKIKVRACSAEFLQKVNKIVRLKVKVDFIKHHNQHPKGYFPQTFHMEHNNQLIINQQVLLMDHTGHKENNKILWSIKNKQWMTFITRDPHLIIKTYIMIINNNITNEHKMTEI